MLRKSTERTSSIHIWNDADGQLTKVTSDLFDERQPEWDPEGKYLFYLSDRSFAPQISEVEWNYAGDRMTGVFAMAFVVPVVLLAAGLYLASTPLIGAAFVVQYLGLLAERWFFFAQANHPQNLYYQLV